MISYVIPYLYLNSSQLEKKICNSIYDLAIEKDSLFIPDFRHDKLIVYSLTNGDIISTYDVPSPHGIAIDQNGIIYIPTLRDNSIIVIENGIFKRIENKQFDCPASIVVNDKYTFIANWGAGNTGDLIFSSDNLNSFDQFTTEWEKSKPHAIRINSQNEILVVYRSPPGLAVYFINGNVLFQRSLPDNFDPLSIVEYKSHYLVPNYNDGQIYLFDNSLNIMDHFFGGGYSPTNLSIWNNFLFISEEKANRILSIDLKIIDNKLSSL